MPPSSHEYSLTPNSKEQASLNLPTRYATPFSLPPAFGIEPALKWSTSTGSGSSYAPSLAGQTHTPSVSGREFETRSAFSPPKTPLSTSQWVEQTSELAPTPSRSSKGPPSVVSYIFNKPRAPRQSRTHTSATPPREEPDPNEHLLHDGVFNVDGPVSSSDNEQDENILEIEDEDDNEGEDDNEDSVYHSVFKYLDTAAREDGDGKKRRRAPKKNKANQRRIPESSDEDVDSDDSNKKPTKRAKVTPSPTKKVPKPKKKMPSKKSISGSGVKRRTPAPAAINPLKKWSGPSQGAIEFMPKPYKFDQDATPLWTYSSDGISRQSPNHCAIGDIHFSPSLALGEDFHYWVQVGAKEGGCWELYYPGRQHPVHAGYVLKGMSGKLPPSWIYCNGSA
ncbi:unnamed protein product [Rhizoctonia solani]|uniref:Uncharacterized protein n=1 Tax=Rhizoctonia solani TaxID=456999 RepID=A0A8H2Y1K3_9AGAM|nr:unnamed protein product [Rhizoctonia solani]